MLKIITFLFLIYSNITKADSFFIDSINEDNKTPTQIHYFKGTNSKALILNLPGGNGGPNAGSPNYWHNNIFIKLSDKNFSSGKYDYTIMPNPYPLEDSYPIGQSLSRGKKDHLLRIESTINYLRQKTKLPIILMGHSAGGLSVMEFIEYIKKDENKKKLIQGIIMSAARNESNKWLENLDIPVIFIHHKNDGCRVTSYQDAEYGFEKMLKKNKSSTVFIAIEGGFAANNPCSDGHHMYFGADEEVRQKLEKELNKINFNN